MKWFKYQSQDYMDCSPVTGYRLFGSLDEAQAWAKHMQENWSGICTILGYASQEELLKAIKYYDIAPDDNIMDNILNKDCYDYNRI